MTVCDVCLDAEDKTIPMGDTDAPGIKERSDGPASLSVKWCGDKSSNLPAERLDNMTDVNRVVRGTSSEKETPNKTIVLTDQNARHFDRCHPGN